jgi:hypothetical protein
MLPFRTSVANQSTGRGPQRRYLRHSRVAAPLYLRTRPNPSRGSVFQLAVRPNGVEVLLLGCKFFRNTTNRPKPRCVKAVVARPASRLSTWPSCFCLVGWVPVELNVARELIEVRMKDWSESGLEEIPAPANAKTGFNKGSRNVSQGSETAFRYQPCPLITVGYGSSGPFHGGNTGSNPVGDAKSFLLEPKKSFDLPPPHRYGRMVA